MESIWMAGTEIRKREPLPGDRKVSAAVIGAGIAGILTAYFLEKAGVSAVVLEADRIGSGQTKNTTAKITSQHGMIYDGLIRTFGQRMAGHYARANEDAIREYERLIQEKGIECDFTWCPAGLYSLEEEVLLKREAEAARALGIEASFEKKCELPFSVAGVTIFERQARFHPLKFLAQIAEEVEVYEQTKVLKVDGNRVETARGCVEADFIVFAVHFPFINIPGYYFARMYQERSYVEAMKGVKSLEGMYLGIDEQGLSFRSQGETLLLGGYGHRTGTKQAGKGGIFHDAVPKGVGGCRYGMLRDKAQALFPGCEEIARWFAQDCMTLDKVPYIGRFSRRKPQWYVATGFGKWGMTSAMVSARVLTALITGKPCPEADIFSPQRHFTARAAKELAVHGGHTVKGLAKHLIPSGNREIIPNCPHMGCRLEWNPEEETYDCPCHGSRFDREGHLIDDPAQTNCRRRSE